MGSTALMWAGGGLLGMSLAKSAPGERVSGLSGRSGGGAGAARPETPEAPIPPDAGSGAAGVTDSALMEAEREKERAAALARRQRAREVFTSGLGASGLASVGKKTLLGG